MRGYRYIIILSLSFLFFGEAAAEKTLHKDTSSVLIQSKLLKVETGSSLPEDDRLNKINGLITLARSFSTKGNYAKAYNCYWEALIMAHEMDDCIYLPKINNGLGILYSIFEMDKEAEKYFHSTLNYLNKKPIKSDLELADLRNTYYILASHNRENGNNKTAQSYIDSCRIIQKEHQSVSSGLIIDAEQGYIYLNMREYQKAIEILKQVEERIPERIPMYRVVLFSMMGEVYFNLGEYEKSEQYLLNSISISEEFKAHQNYIPDAYQKLSNLYLKMGELRDAHHYLQISKDSAEKLFGIRSNNNRDLLEVKDAFRNEVEKQNRALEDAYLLDLEQSKEILFLQLMMLAILLVSLIIISVILFRNQHIRRKQEQVSYKQKQKLSSEKNAEILDVKNKELTSSALQLIQKDELILEIKEQLLELNDVDKHSLNKILNKIKVNKSQDWTEFNARFSSVNQEFYDNLKATYPKLTQKDQKLCALLKLNFSSKEISQLLGISMESVNAARYRLRKKMQLKKEDDLIEVISAL